MLYDIESRPVTYCGVSFRSLLEARWARLFDEIGIPWEYEPRDMGGWLPDFEIWGKFLVEVKPVAPKGREMARDPAFSKAIRPYATILLGDGPGWNFGCLALGKSDGKIHARTIVYDQWSRYKMATTDREPPETDLSELQWIWRDIIRKIERELVMAVAPRRCFGGA